MEEISGRPVHARSIGVNSRHHGYNKVARKLDQVVGEETQTREQPS